MAGLCFTHLVNHESIRKSIRIDTEVRGTPACGVQVSGGSLDDWIWAYIGSCPGDEHHYRAGGGAARAGCRRRGGHRQCGEYFRAAPMPVRRSRVVRVQCRRGELQEVNAAFPRQGRSGRQQHHGRVPAVGVRRRGCAAGIAETEAGGDEAVFRAGLSSGADRQVRLAQDGH